jgi:hypothetical protein
MATYAEVVRYRDSNWGRIEAVMVEENGRDAGVYNTGVGGGVYVVEIVSGTPSIGDFYDFDTETWTTTDPNLEYPRRFISAKEFWIENVTADERAKIWALCSGEANVPKYDNSEPVSISIENRYRLAAFRDITLSGGFYLDNSEVITVIDALETIELISPGRADIILERP